MTRLEIVSGITCSFGSKAEAHCLYSLQFTIPLWRVLFHPVVLLSLYHHLLSPIEGPFAGPAVPLSRMLSASIIRLTTYVRWRTYTGLHTLGRGQQAVQHKPRL
jgi:hypothetical protein